MNPPPGVRWKKISVAKGLNPDRPIIRPAVKIAARAYRSSGAFPIIDQGQHSIAGWTDELAAVLKPSRPVVVFGDHTRIFKYIAFPFAAGADGTLILNPSEDFDPLFFFFACLELEIPGRGYNRHYSVLKELRLPKPSLEEQKAVASVLRKAQEAIEVESALINVSRELKQAALNELFTKRLRGEVLKEEESGQVPESWQEVRIDELGKVVTGTTPKTANRSYYDEGTFDFIAPGDISENGVEIRSAVKKLTSSGMDQCRVLPKGASCFVCIGSSIGKVGITTQDLSSTNQQINSVIPNEAFNPYFVFYTLLWNAEWIAARANPSPVPIMSKSLFAEVPIWITWDETEQKEIASVLQTIDAKLAYHESRHKLLRELFQSLLHDLMTGKRWVNDLTKINSEENAAA
ncbi:MAG: restriction endonuclease subunit S [Verrucomicrobiota bacterium]